YDAAGGERTDEARDADLAQIRIHLHLGEDGAVRMKRIVLGCRIARSLASTLDLGKPGPGEDVGIVFAAAFILPVVKAPGTGDDPGVAGSETRRGGMGGCDRRKPCDGILSRRV